MTYDARDYQQNPGKYQLFKTAQIARHVVTHNGEQDLREGMHVAIKFRCEAFNALLRRKEPVYTITATENGKMSEHVDLYGNCLMNFVL